jgi:hypothetical protein
MPQGENDMKYIIGCRVSGGATGTRESILKNRDGVVRFDAKPDAMAMVAELRATMNLESSTAYFQYWVEAVDDDA